MHSAAHSTQVLHPTAVVFDSKLDTRRSLLHIRGAQVEKMCAQYCGTQTLCIIPIYTRHTYLNTRTTRHNTSSSACFRFRLHRICCVERPPPLCRAENRYDGFVVCTRHLTSSLGARTRFVYAEHMFTVPCRLCALCARRRDVVIAIRFRLIRRRCPS